MAPQRGAAATILTAMFAAVTRHKLGGARAAEGVDSPGAVNSVCSHALSFAVFVENCTLPFRRTAPQQGAAATVLRAMDRAVTRHKLVGLRAAEGGDLPGAVNSCSSHA
jgi:hypothetical protein